MRTRRAILFLLVLSFGSAEARAAAPPARLTRQQSKLLNQRNHLLQQANTLLGAGQTDKAISAVQQALKRERDIFGTVSGNVLAWLEWLAPQQEAREQFHSAITSRRELLALRQQQYEADDWRLVDARLDLEDVQRLARRAASPRRRLRQAERWNLEVVRLWQQGKSAEALPLALKALAARRELLGEKDRHTGRSWFNLGAQYAALHRTDQALRCYRQALEVRQAVLGKKHPDCAMSLNNLAQLYQAMGEHSKALPLFLEARDLRRKLLGEKHPDYATSLSNLATLYRATGEHSKALPLLLETRDLFRQVLGEKHPDYARSLTNLAVLYQAMGEHGKALPLFLEARDLFRTVLGEKHPHYTLTLNNLAGLYRDRGESGKALPLLLEARDLSRKVLGKMHPDYATSLNSLGLLYQAMGEYSKALPLFLEARDLSRTVLGQKHPDYSRSLNNLAVLYWEMGKHGKALPLLLEACDINRKVLGEKHPTYATSLNNLATLYQDMGEHDKALSLLLETRALFRTVLGQKHPDYARSLTCLAALYKEMGEHDKALPLLLEARDLFRTVLGQKHPLYATSLNWLAFLYQDMGKPGKALPLFLEARDLRRTGLGEKHPLYANSLNNLAALYQAIGEHSKALPLLLEARDLFRTVLGEKHPHYAASLNNLAALYQAMGEPGKALAVSRQALAVLESYLEDGFDHLGEVQRAQITGNVLNILGALLSFQEQAGLPLAQAYDAVLAWKGRVAARGALDRLLRDRPELKGPLSRLQSVRGRLARLGLQTPDPRRHAAWLKELQSLADEKVALESELSGLSAKARKLPQRDRLTPAQVSKDLPAGIVFVDLLEYAHFAPAPGGKGKPRGEWRLLAFVVRHGKEPVAVPLGALQPISDAVAPWRAEVEKPPAQANRKAITQAGEELRRRVWLPLVKHLGGAKTVVMAPDGVLCQLPLPALPGEKPGSFLLEEIGIAQVSSAQHLVELLQPAQKPREPARGLLAVGGVDYGPGKFYAALPGTAAEVDRCRMLFRSRFPDEPAESLSGKGASVAAVRQTLAEKRPRFLHLATHGFFEPHDRVERLLRGAAAGKDGLGLGREQTVTLAGLPFLRCGLALAGANQADGAEGLRGVLSGEDVEGLDLRGCELAVLSACQTALGDIKQSQGVLGLQRSFHAAGARTLVTCLWSVSDAATLVLMEEFYARLWGKGKLSGLEALRQAQLVVLRNPQKVQKRAEVLLADARKRGISEDLLRGVGKKAVLLPDGGKVGEDAKRSPEAWWAAFVLSGDWR